MSEFMRKVVDFAVSKIGCGYIYGATGWVCTPARRAQQAAQYPDQYSNIMVVGAKWDGKQCFDCAQLTRWAVEAAGVKLPSGANSQFVGDYWSVKGAIGGIPLARPCFVFRLSDGRAQHVGIYIGNGDVVEARGTKDGVIRSKLEAYAWTHYTEHREAGTNTNAGGEEQMEDHETPYEAMVDTGSSKIGLNYRMQPSIKAAKIASCPEIPKEALLTVLEHVDAEWARVNYAGVTGYVMREFLRPHTMPAPGPDAGDAHVVTVSDDEIANVAEMIRAEEERHSKKMAEILEIINSWMGVWG